LTRLGYLAVFLGLLTVAVVSWGAFFSGKGTPSGMAVYDSRPVCCGDCSCVNGNVCMMCGSCSFISSCRSYSSDLGAGGFILVTPARVRDNSSFLVDAVLKSATAKKVLVEVDTPNGFAVVSKNPVLVELDGGQTRSVPFEVVVKPGVAEEEYVLTAKATDVEWSTVGSARVFVSVYSASPNA